MQAIQLKFDLTCSFPVIFTRHVFNPDNPALLQVLRKLDRAVKVIIVIDAAVAAVNPRLMNEIESFSEYCGDLLALTAPVCIIAGGSDCRRDGSAVKKIVAFLNNYRLGRHDVVIAIGGGAALDAAGVAAAVVRRGIRLVRMPTTTFAQNDAGMNIKGGIDLLDGKTFNADFTPPLAVVNDFDFLGTLAERDCRAGIAQAVKIALIRDRGFFDFLCKHKRGLNCLDPAIMEDMTLRCVRLQVQNNGDFREQGMPPLVLARWAAQRIEKQDEEDMRHGEALAVGLAVEAAYAFVGGMLTEIELHRILSLLRSIGFDLFHPVLHRIIFYGDQCPFSDLPIPLIRGIGKVALADRMEMELMVEAVNLLSAKQTRNTPRSDCRKQRYTGG